MESGLKAQREEYVASASNELKQVLPLLELIIKGLSVEDAETLTFITIVDMLIKKEALEASEHEKSGD